MGSRFVLFCFVLLHVGPATSTYGHVAHVPGAGGAQPAITAHMARPLYWPPVRRLQPIRIPEAFAGPNCAVRPVQVACCRPLCAPGTPRVPEGTHGYRSRDARTCTLGPRPSGQTTGYGCRNAHPTPPVCWKLPRAPPLVSVVTGRDRDPPHTHADGSPRENLKRPLVPLFESLWGSGRR